MIIFLSLVGIILIWYIYDKYVQREHQILVNYPIIGRLRHLFEEVREPFRQYFGDEKFYESKDKLDWVYTAAKDLPNFTSFSPSQPLPKPKFLLRHSTIVLNDDEVSDNFNVSFGEKLKYPFITNSIIGRGAMSDGSISPEGTRAFVRGSYTGKFPINTGEGSLTSNFLVTLTNYDPKYMSIVEGSSFHRFCYKAVKKVFNHYYAARIFRKLVFKNNPELGTYIFNKEKIEFHRVNWDAPIDVFPATVPEDLPDIIFQLSSGLYGARDKNGKFDEQRYKKTMSFCRMTEIKLAQGAKQTGGKLAGSKVTEAIAYYRGVEVGKDLFSPNRFPYASTINELLDFVGRLQKLSNKPVGIKIVISDYENIVPIAQEIKKRIDNGNDSYPDFISVDGGSGGTATAPIELMERIGLNARDAVYLVNKVLEEHQIRDKIKIIASGKVLTPDDVVIIMSLGADFVQIARGFMMSAGCIRARYCSGTTGRECPVGLATQDKKKRANFFENKHATYTANYHKNILKGIRTILAVMGKSHYSQLSKHNIMFLDRNAKVHDNMDELFDRKLSLKNTGNIS